LKAVILCGGLGTRLSEKTTDVPKPMVNIGESPMLWNIMKIYEAYGINEFVIALGYRGDVIKDYFLNYRNRASNLTVQLGTGQTTIKGGPCEDWTVHLLDTGMDTQTGGRVKQAAEYIGNEPFMLTYGDGVASVDIQHLLAFHQKSGRIGTVTAVRPPARFGGLSFEGDLVSEFIEKPQIGEGWINGGFFVLQPEIVKYIEGEATIFEREPLEQLVEEQQLGAFRHEGFWQCMDTLRDVRFLNRLWQGGNAPWKVW